MSRMSVSSETTVDDIVDSIVRGQDEAFGRERSHELTVHDGYKTPAAFEAAYRALNIHSKPNWASSITKLILCANHEGLVSILVGASDWRTLLSEVQLEEVLEELVSFAEMEVASGIKGVPNSFVVYAGEVPSRVRPNTAVAFFCSEPKDKAGVLLSAIRKAAYKEYRQVLEFDAMQRSVKGVGYAFLTNAWMDTPSLEGYKVGDLGEDMGITQVRMDGKDNRFVRSGIDQGGFFTDKGEVDIKKLIEDVRSDKLSSKSALSKLLDSGYSEEQALILVEAAVVSKMLAS